MSKTPCRTLRRAPVEAAQDALARLAAAGVLAATLSANVAFSASAAPNMAFLPAAASTAAVMPTNTDKKIAADTATDIAGVDATLSAFHKAASEADWDTYFNLLSDDAIFLGTDVTEHWTKAQFKAFAQNTKGWTYSLRERHIYFASSANTAWFDEVLDNKAYGTSRGTGVLIRTPAGWKIAQYHLVFPIPNDLAGEITQSIQEFESKAAQP